MNNVYDRRTAVTAMGALSALLVMTACSTTPEGAGGGTPAPQPARVPSQDGEADVDHEPTATQSVAQAGASDAGSTATQGGSGAASGQPRCSALAPAASSDLPMALEPAQQAFRVTGEGACRPTPRSDRAFIASSTEPRRLGSQLLTVLHPGDFLIVPRSTRGPADWPDDPSARDALRDAKAEKLDTRFKPLKGELPPSTRPMSQLSEATGGVLEAVGTFNFRDERDADGSASVQVLVRAAQPGQTSFKLIQHYEKTARGQTVEKGYEERSYTVQVVGENAPVTTRFGDLEAGGQPVMMGPRDVWALSIPLGYMNRGGSEERGPVGVMKVSTSGRP